MELKCEVRRLECSVCYRKIIVELVTDDMNARQVSVSCGECVRKVGAKPNWRKAFPGEAKLIDDWLGQPDRNAEPPQLKFLEAGTMTSLVDQVNRHLAEGWLIYGEITIGMARNPKAPPGVIDEFYYQLMRRGAVE